MIDISRHIEYLLLEHDSVCVPQLGTFSIQQSESRWVPEEELFLPPVRNVSFSSDCSQGADDFIRSLALALRVNSEQAQTACAEYVENMKQELAANSVAEVGSIGMFVRDTATGTDCFMPCQAGVTSPEFYGLDSVYQPRLPESVRQAEAAAQQAVRHIQKDDKHVTIRIPRSLLYYASAAAAAIIIFFSFSTPAVYTSPGTEATVATANLFLPANLLPSAEVSQEPIVEEAQSVSQQNSQTNAAAPATSNPVPVQNEVKADAEAVKAQATAVSAESKPAEPAVTEVKAEEKAEVKPAKQTEFAVVLASAVSNANAERYVKELNGRGIKAEMRAKGSMTRVLVPGFKSSDEAYSYARRIRMQSEEFESAWVLKL